MDSSQYEQVIKWCVCLFGHWMNSSSGFFTQSESNILRIRPDLEYTICLISSKFEIQNSPSYYGLLICEVCIIIFYFNAQFIK